MNSRQWYKLASASTLLVAATAAPVGAQVTAGQNEPDAKLEEIVVTAQKRTENLQNVPIAVQVISGQALKEQNYNNFGDLAQTVPAVAHRGPRALTANCSSGASAQAITGRSINPLQYSMTIFTTVDRV